MPRFELNVSPLAGFIVLVIVLIFFGYFLIIRPWTMRWGATAQEVTMNLPGDEFVPNSKQGYTQAVTVHATPTKVWPWLVQIGYGRAGWYSYDWIEGLLNANHFIDGRHSSNRIVPELQELKAGDTIAIHPAGPFEVLSVKPGEELVMGVRINMTTGKSFGLTDPTPEHFINLTWGFYLREIKPGETRLITRWRYDADPSLANKLAFGVFIDGGAFMMQPKMLLGMKARAERMN